MAPKRMGDNAASKNKRPRADPLAAKYKVLAEALEKGSQNASSTQILLQLLPQCLCDAKESRHPLQVRSIELIEKGLDECEEALKKDVSEAKEKMEVLSAQKDTREAEAEQAREAEKLTLEASERDQRDLAEEASKFRTAKAALEAAIEEQKAGDQSLVHADNTKAKLELLMTKYVEPFKNGTVPVSEQTSRCNEAIKRLRGFSIDETMLTTVRTVFSKDHAEISKFEWVTIRSLEETLAGKVEEQTSILNNGAEGRQQRGAKVAAAREAFDAAKKVQFEKSKIFQTSWNSKTEAKEIATKKNAAWKSFAKELKEATDALDSAEAELEVHYDYTIATFKELVERTEPAPTEVLPAAGPAEEADVSAPMAVEATAIAVA